MTTTQNEMRIYITNLGKYNEGILQGEWFTLPVDMTEVAEVIGLNAQYEEWAIHDYELPFSIGEYENIDKLNEIAEQLENSEVMELVSALKSDNKYDVNIWGNLALNVFSELEIDHEIVDGDQINEMIKNKINNEDAEWESLKHFTWNANMNNEYHLIDGYENVIELNYTYAENVLSDYFDELKQ